MKRIPFKGISNNSSFPRRRESSFIKYLDSRLRGNDNKGGGSGTLKSQACQAGVTLVEMVTFIVIVTIAMVGLMNSYTSILGRAPTAAQITQATQLAQERMELILSQKDVQGYTSLGLDPCLPVASAVCPTPTLPLGFSVDVLGVNPSAAWLANPLSQYRLITVTVTGPQGTQLTELQSVLANY